MRIQSPCKDCPDRHLGCHSECDKYKAFKVNSLNYKEEVIKVRNKEAYFNDKAVENARRKRKKQK